MGAISPIYCIITLNPRPYTLNSKLRDSPCLWKPPHPKPSSPELGFSQSTDIRSPCLGFTADLSLTAVPSIEVTCVSFARQPGPAEELRRQQGHHRVATAAMVDLYSCDDVAGPLRLQQQLATAIIQGFQPLRAQMRGSRPPCPDVDVCLAKDTDLDAVSIPCSC